MADSLRDAPRSNEGISVAATEPLRQLNALDLPDGPHRRALIKWLRSGTPQGPLPGALLEYLDRVSPQDVIQGEIRNRMIEAATHDA